MKINLLIMIALTVLLVLLAPLLVMGIINLGNNIKSGGADDAKEQVSGKQMQHLIFPQWEPL